MANFTESATLKLIDQSSANARKINAELKALFNTANRLKNLNGALKISANLGQSRSQIQALTRDLNKLTSGNRSLPPIKVRVDSSQVDLAIRRLGQLRAAVGQTLPALKVPAAVAGGRGGVAGVPNNMLAPRGGDSNWQAAGRIIARSFTAAVGVDLYGAIRGAAQTAGKAILREDSALGSLRQTGISGAALETRLGQARDVSKAFPTLSTGVVLNSTRELGNLALTAADARAQMMVFGKTASNLGTALGDSEAGAESARQIFRTISLLGFAQNPTKSAEFAAEATRSIISSGGDVLGAEIRRMVQQLRGQGLDISPQALGDLTSIRDEGGMASTAEIRTFMNDLTRSNLNKKDLAKQKKAGLRDSAGDTVDRAALLANPVTFAVDKIGAKLEKLGVNLDNAADVQKGLSKLGFTQSGQAFAARAIGQRQQIEADRAARARVDLDTALKEKTVATNAAAAKAQFENAAASATKAALPFVNSALETATTSLNRLADPNVSLADKGKETAKLALAAGAISAANLPAALLDKQAAPFAVAGIGLTTAATALTGSAGALTAAAKISAATDKAGAMSKIGKLALGATVAGAAALGAAELVQFLDEGGTLSTDAEKKRRQLLERKNNPFGSSGERDKAIKDAMDAQRARGERIDPLKAESDARQKIIAESDRQIAALDAQIAAINANTAALQQSEAAKVAAQTKPQSDAQTRLNEVKSAQSVLGEARSALNAANVAIADLDKREKTNAKIQDPLTRRVKEEELAQDRKNFPEKRARAEAQIAAAQIRVADAYKGIDLPAEAFKTVGKGRNAKKVSTDTAETADLRKTIEAGKRQQAEFDNEDTRKRLRLPKAAEGAGGAELAVSLGAFPEPAKALSMSILEMPNSMKAAIDTGSTTLGTAGTTFGTNAMSALEGGGSTFGSNAAAAFLSQVSGLRIGVNATSGPNVGTARTTD